MYKWDIEFIHTVAGYSRREMEHQGFSESNIY
jgi:hypothetical protein